LKSTHFQLNPYFGCRF